MPTKKPRGEELTLAQQRANQALNQRRLRIAHVNSSVKRCRIVKDRLRLWKEGVRDLVMELWASITASATFGHSASPDNGTWWHIMALQGAMQVYVKYFGNFWHHNPLYSHHL